MVGSALRRRGRTPAGNGAEGWGGDGRSSAGHAGEWEEELGGSGNRDHTGPTRGAK